jgi:hypothetical protein
MVRKEKSQRHQQRMRMERKKHQLSTELNINGLSLTENQRIYLNFSTE